MKARIQKWRNSLMVRIPKSTAAEAGLEANTWVELSVENGKLVIQRPNSATPSLEALLDLVSKENLHGEWKTGLAVGREVC